MEEYRLLSEKGFPLVRFHTVHIRPTSTRVRTEMFTAMRVVLITAGSARWMIGRHLHAVCAGQAALLGSAVPRTFMTVDPPDGVRLEVYEFTPAAVGESFECLAAFRVRDEDCVLSDGDGALFALLRDIRGELADNRPYRAEMIRARTVVALTELSRRVPGQEERSTGVYATEITRAAAFIWNNLASDLSVARLAADAGMCRGRFSALFRSAVGLGVTEYVARCRCRSAVALIRGGSKVLDAALASGFESGSGFYKTFGRVTGMTPKEYLKKGDGEIDHQL